MTMLFNLRFFKKLTLLLLFFENKLSQTTINKQENISNVLTQAVLLFTAFLHFIFKLVAFLIFNFRKFLVLSFMHFIVYNNLLKFNSSWSKLLHLWKIILIIYWGNYRFLFYYLDFCGSTFFRSSLLCFLFLFFFFFQLF